MDKQTQELMFSSENPNYETPNDLFLKYKKKHNITIDVCATADNAKLKNFISPEQDIFKTTWKETGWMNPPYNKPENKCKKKCKRKKCNKRGSHNTEYIPGQIDFVARVALMADYGATTICLLPARTDTELFFTYIWDEQLNRPKDKVEVEFVKGRIKFKGAKDPAPFPSMIVIFHSKV